MSAIKPDVKHADSVKSWRPACETSGTLSRSHPKVKKSFEERARRQEAELAAAKKAKEQSTRVTADLERVDARWRKEDPDKFVVRPFAVFRLTHDGLRLAMQDLVGTVAKIGTSAIVMIKLKTQFEDFSRTFRTYAKIEEGNGGVYDILDHYNRSQGKVSELEGLTDYNTLFAEELQAIDVIIAEAQSGNHASAELLKRSIPEIANLIEICLQSKEETYAKYGLAAKLDSDKNNVALVKAALDNANDAPDSLKFLGPFMTKQLASKRPFGNIKMYVASLHLGMSASAFSAIEPALGKAARDSTGANIWDKIAAFL